ncbi:MAG: oligosaccharide flippase family protein [Candidatus Eiseniibacteriota bacterium]
MSRGARSAAESVARGGRVLLLGTLGSKALRLAGDLVVGRLLGPAAFGVVAASTSLVSILTEVCQLGVHRGVLRFSSVLESRGEAGRSRALARRALVVPLAGGLVAVAAAILVREPLTRALFGDDVDPWLLPVFALAIPLGGAVTVLQFAARAAKRFRADAVVGEGLRLGLPLAATCVLIGLGWGLWGVAWGLVAGLFAAAALGWAVLARGGPGEPPASAPQAERLGEVLRVALPLALASSAVLLMNELDKVLLAVFRPEEDVGRYNAAFRISRQANLLLPALTGSIAPWVAPLLAEGREEELRDLYRRTTQWTLAAGLPVFAVLVLFAPQFLALFGPSFVEGGALLIVLALGQLVIAVAGSAAMVLQLSGRERLELRNGAMALGLNLTMNLVLIPAHGAMGAAAATATSLSFLSVIRVVQARRVLGTVPWSGATSGALRMSFVAAAGGALAGFAAGALSASAPVIALAACAGLITGALAFVALVGLDAADAAVLPVPRRFVRRRAADPSGATPEARSREGSPPGSSAEPAAEPASAGPEDRATAAARPAGRRTSA